MKMIPESKNAPFKSPKKQSSSKKSSTCLIQEALIKRANKKLSLTTTGPPVKNYSQIPTILFLNKLFLYTTVANKSHQYQQKDPNTATH